MCVSMWSPKVNERVCGRINFEKVAVGGYV